MLTLKDFERIGKQGVGNPRSQIAHSMARFKGRIYLGVTHPKADGPTDAARILRYVEDTGEWETIHKSPLVRTDENAAVKDIYRQNMGEGGGALSTPTSPYVPRDRGYRCMTLYTPNGSDEPVLFTSTLSHWGSRLLVSRDGETFEVASEPGLGREDILSFRNLVPFNGKLFVAPAGSVQDGVMDRNFGDIARLFVADDPLSGEWREAMEPGFGDPNNLSIFCMRTFNGYLYAGTGNPKRGFQLWKTRAEGELPFEWTCVLHDGAYRYNINETAATLVEFNNQLYLSSGIPGLGMDMANDIGPAAAELIRLDPDDSWEIIAGEPRFTPDGLKVPLSLMGPGFDEPENSVFWSMTAHDGALYVGTHHNRMWRDTLGGADEVKGGFHLWASEDGEQFEAITLNGFDDPYATGVRSLLSTPEGLFVGTTTHRDVERLWRLRTRKGGRAGVGGLEIWLGAKRS